MESWPHNRPNVLKNHQERKTIAGIASLQKVQRALTKICADGKILKKFDSSCTG